VIPTTWPAYSWIATLPSTITVSVAGTSEVLTVTDVDPRGLASSGAVADVLGATLLTHTLITGVVVAYDWAAVVPRYTVTCTVAAGAIVVTGAERFGVPSAASFGSGGDTSIAVAATCWDGLWNPRAVVDLRFPARWSTARTSSRYGKARTQTRLARIDSGIDERVMVPARWVDPRYAADAGYAEQARTSATVTTGTLLDLVEAQLAGARDTGPNLSPTAWLWRHTSDSDLAGTAIDLVLPDGEFDLSDLASPASGGGRRVNVALAWLTL
jgi:hypothetical protein